MPELRLNEEKNCYELGDQAFLRVSTVLELAGLNDPMPDNMAIQATIKRGMNRGTLVDQAAECYDLHGSWYLDPARIPADYLAFDQTPEEYISLIAVRVEGWKKFRTERMPNATFECQKTVYSTELGVAGTLDRLFTLPDGSKTIVDIKCGSLKWYNDIQVGAYRFLLNDPDVDTHMLVHLGKDGKYRDRPAKTPEDDEMDFLAACRIAKRRLRHTRSRNV